MRKRSSKPETRFGSENRLREMGWSLRDEKDWYAELLERVRRNPRFYLDNLSDFEVYRVSFINYDPYSEYKDGTLREYQS